MSLARRVAAVVLPQLACEIVRQRAEVAGPLGVIFESHEDSSLAQGSPAPPLTTTLDAVDDEAWRYGVRPGQRVVEAAALVAHLAIHRVTHEELDVALGRVAEVAMAFGTTAAIRLVEQSAGETRGASGDAPFDTVWVDITGAAHLVGGEEALLDELCERVAALGHRVRGAIADGPRLAQALARWAQSPRSIAPAGQGARAMAPLPVRALPIASDTVSFLIRVGVFTLGELGGLPRAGAAARLGPRAAEVLELVAGRDAAPLVAYSPPRTLMEETSFEEGIGEVEPLLFVLRGMTSRVAARLAARGEACLELEVVIGYDRSIARLRRLNEPAAATGAETAAEDRKEELRLGVELPAPLSDANDLLRALKAKLERLDLMAPAVELKLVVPRIVEAHRAQLDLSRDTAVSPDALPALLAELSAEIGAERVGVLRIHDAHRPEARSQLVPIESIEEADRGAGDAALPAPGEEPSRLLPTPALLGKVARGAVVAIDKRLYAIDRVRFVMRLDAVEWWTPEPASRDYVRVWLSCGDSAARLRKAWDGGGHSGFSCAEAWVYIDRATGQGYLQGWCE